MADKKERWFEGGPRGGNLEHQPSGLIWAIDNWIYTSYNAYRLRWTPTGVIKEKTGPNNGQWGVGQDNYGRIYFMNGGGEKGPQSFQAPTVYGGFNPKEQFAPGFETVWPIAGVRDFQGGPSRVREPDGTLNHFTATSGAEIYRGDRLPAELRNDLFFGEPVGRLVRRAKVTHNGGMTVLSNPYQEQQSEFLRSTDLCFRPLNFATAPDGTMYVVDMYRGIIQEGNWVREGSYLRKVVEQYSFQNVTDLGRIWRLTHDAAKPGPQPRMYQETPAQLVAHLAHPNGWWRDMAQRLLILKQDKSVVPALAEMVKKHAAPLARIHALWTLEGLNAVTPELVREKLRDADANVRGAAIRVSESLYKAGDKSLQPEITALAKDPDPNVTLQAMLTANALAFPEAKTLTASLASASTFAGVKAISDTIVNPPVPQAPAQKLTEAEKKLMTAGAEIFSTLCATCHGPDGKGLAMAGAAPGAMLAPSLAGSKTVNGHLLGPINVMLNGLTGDIDGKKYEGLMVSMATNDDRWIASVLSYIRNSFGNHAGFVTPEEVSKQRAAVKDRTQPWTIAELRSALPQPLNHKGWKVSASHNSAGARAAVDGDTNSRFDTHTSQVPGMWFMVELSSVTTISGLELDTTKSARDYPRGYNVQVSLDGQVWSKPVAEGKGTDAVTKIEFSPTKAKFVRINQTGAVNGLFWSIHEMQVFTPPGSSLTASAK